MVTQPSPKPFSIDQDLLKADVASITTVIDDGVRLEGKLVCTSGKTIMVNGEVVGGIHSNGPVIVDRGGSVRGSIRALALQVEGRVERLSAQDVVEVDEALIIGGAARVECDMVYGCMRSELGARISGQLSPRDAVLVSDAPEADALAPVASVVPPGGGAEPGEDAAGGASVYRLPGASLAAHG